MSQSVINIYEKGDDSEHSFQIVSSSYIENASTQGKFTLSTLKRSIANTFTRTFLPAGYPESVRPEYLSYQLWDSLQALCSYLRSVLTIQAILTGAGVGNAAASTVATTLAWVMKGERRAHTHKAYP